MQDWCTTLVGRTWRSVVVVTTKKAQTLVWSVGGGHEGGLPAGRENDASETGQGGLLEKKAPKSMRVRS